MKKRQVNIILKGYGKLPVYATEHAAGADLYSANAANIIIYPNEDAEGCIRPRSGLSLKKGLVAIIGTIDADYQGEVGIILHNTSDTAWTIERGERLAQIVFNGDGGLFQAEWNRVTEFTRKSDRGEGGFGHTGVKAL